VKIKNLTGASLAILLLCVSTPVFAQGGGKAEPLRIEIKRGATSAKVKGKVRGDVQAEYVFAARKGQQVKITLTSEPARSSLFELRSADGVDYKLEYNGRDWNGLAPATGDYFINVMRRKDAPSSSRYSLTMTIR
jgi:hypothetical protein